METNNMATKEEEYLLSLMNGGLNSAPTAVAPEAPEAPSESTMVAPAPVAPSPEESELLSMMSGGLNTEPTQPSGPRPDMADPRNRPVVPGSVYDTSVDQDTLSAPSKVGRDVMALARAPQNVSGTVASWLPFGVPAHDFGEGFAKNQRLWERQIQDINKWADEKQPEWEKEQQRKGFGGKTPREMSPQERRKLRMEGVDVGNPEFSPKQIAAGSEVVLDVMGDLGVGAISRLSAKSVDKLMRGLAGVVKWTTKKPYIAGVSNLANVTPDEMIKLSDKAFREQVEKNYKGRYGEANKAYEAMYNPQAPTDVTQAVAAQTAKEAKNLDDLKNEWMDVNKQIEELRTTKGGGEATLRDLETQKLELQDEYTALSRQQQDIFSGRKSTNELELEELGRTQAAQQGVAEEAVTKAKGQFGEDKEMGVLLQQEAKDAAEAKFQKQTGQVATKQQQHAPVVGEQAMAIKSRLNKYDGVDEIAATGKELDDAYESSGVTIDADPIFTAMSNKITELKANPSINISADIEKDLDGLQTKFVDHLRKQHPSGVVEAKDLRKLRQTFAAKIPFTDPLKDVKTRILYAGHDAMNSAITKAIPKVGDLNKTMRKQLELRDELDDYLGSSAVDRKLIEMSNPEMGKYIPTNLMKRVDEAFPSLGVGKKSKIAYSIERAKPTPKTLGQKGELPSKGGIESAEAQLKAMKVSHAEEVAVAKKRMDEAFGEDKLVAQRELQDLKTSLERERKQKIAELQGQQEGVSGKILESSQKSKEIELSMAKAPNNFDKEWADVVTRGDTEGRRKLIERATPELKPTLQAYDEILTELENSRDIVGQHRGRGSEKVKGGLETRVASGEWSSEEAPTILKSMANLDRVAGTNLQQVAKDIDLVRRFYGLKKEGGRKVIDKNLVIPIFGRRIQGMPTASSVVGGAAGNQGGAQTFGLSQSVTGNFGLWSGLLLAGATTSGGVLSPKVAIKYGIPAIQKISKAYHAGAIPAKHLISMTDLGGTAGMKMSKWTMAIKTYSNLSESEQEKLDREIEAYEKAVKQKNEKASKVLGESIQKKFGFSDISTPTTKPRNTK